MAFCTPEVAKLVAKWLDVEALKSARLSHPSLRYQPGKQLHRCLAPPGRDTQHFVQAFLYGRHPARPLFDVYPPGREQCPHRLEEGPIQPLYPAITPCAVRCGDVMLKPAYSGYFAEQLVPEMRAAVTHQKGGRLEERQPLVA